MPIRKTNILDAKAIQSLINESGKAQEVLPRSINDIYEHIRDFFVFSKNKKIIGCCALHIAWEDLAEIRSLVVKSGSRGNGIGRELIVACLKEARELKIKKLFLLTGKPDFFRKFGFYEIEKSLLPHKIWSDCTSCVLFPDCNEIAMIREFTTESTESTE
ncbi:MAG: N-acetyltransferase [Candidatus Omnitrophica bacterium]|nr:N-acetyltransferase [Candidatus Omnitrophota bacterium]